MMATKIFATVTVLSVFAGLACAALGVNPKFAIPLFTPLLVTTIVVIWRKL